MIKIGPVGFEVQYLCFHLTKTTTQTTLYRQIFYNTFLGSGFKTDISVMYDQNQLFTISLIFNSLLYSIHIPTWILGIGDEVKLLKTKRISININGVQSVHE